MTLLRRAQSVLIAALATCLAAGCAHVPSGPVEVVRTVEVKVPVAVACPALADIGADPAYVDSPEALRAAPDIYEATRLLIAGRAQRMQRLAEYAAAKLSCTF